MPHVTTGDTFTAKLTFMAGDLVDRPQDVLRDVEAARGAVENQPVILDKLKHAEIVVGIIKNSLKAIDDVSVFIGYNC